MNKEGLNKALKKFIMYICMFISSLGQGDWERVHSYQIEMMKKGLNYKLEEGKIYLVQEKIPSISLEGFNDLISLDHNSIAISRRDEKGFRKMSPGIEKYFWLSETGADGSIEPELGNGKRSKERSDLLR